MIDKTDYEALVKRLYGASVKTPQIIDIGPLDYAMMDGEGDPNTSAQFQEAVGALYALSYGIKMLPKKGAAPEGYFEYKVPALEGLWTLPDGEDFDPAHKERLRWTLMILQPPFVTRTLFEEVREAQRKKKGMALAGVRLETLAEGLCCQMLHLGPFDDEPATFAKMEAFICEEGCSRTGRDHHEIYLSDFRKTAPEKLKTVLRFGVKKG